MKLEERINVIPVESKELGFTKPGSYIYELFSDLNITHETASMLIATIEDASVLLEESNQLQSKGNTCRLEHMGEVLKLVFKEKNNSHAKYYRVSLHCLLVCSLWAHDLADQKQIFDGTFQLRQESYLSLICSVYFV